MSGASEPETCRHTLWQNSVDIVRSTQDDVGMYLRTLRRKNKNGTTVTYYQLAHNARHPESGHPVAQVVHSFGRADQLDRDELVRLCRSIARVCDLEINDPQHRQRELFEELSEAGLPESIRLLETLELGPIHVIEALWERLGIGPELRELTRRSKTSVPYERALLAMTANRLCEPDSKLGVWDRWLEQVYLPSAREVGLSRMYEAMDLLDAHAEELEKAVFFRTADLFNLTVDLVFYDATAATFAIDEGDLEPPYGTGLRKYGENSEGVWKPQVVVALAVTREGLPVRSWVFPGNTVHVSTVEQVKQDLRGWKLGRALFVADAGMNSKENREELAKGAGKYLLAMRMASVKEVRQDVLRRGGRYRKLADNLRVKEVKVGDGELHRRYLLCHNPLQEKHQREHRKQVLRELEEELASHGTRDATAKWAIQLMASRRYGRYLKVGQGKQVEIDRAAAKAAERHDGKWVLITNDDTLTTEDAATGYRGLMIIERCFRALKRTRIQMTPMHHWLPRRIRAHVKICVLALLIARTAELKTGLTWEEIRHRLRRLKATAFESERYHFFQRNDVAPDTSRVLQALDIKPPERVLDVVKAS